MFRSKTQWKQREVCPAKVGDKIYFISGNWGKPELVTVIGECEEGSGYEAFSERFKAEYAIEHPDHPDGEPSDPNDPDDDPNWKPGNFHTCNGFICKTHTEARAESLVIAKRERDHWAQKRKEATQVVQYLDWVIARKGKH